MTSISVEDLSEMAADILDLTPDGWDRTIYFDLSKLTEEVGEVAEALNKSSMTDEDLGDELADVIKCVHIIALKRKINLKEALVRKQKNRIQRLVRRFHNNQRPEGLVLRHEL